MPTTSSSSFDFNSLSTLLDYDNRILELTAHLKILKQDRNRLLPLYRLPNEILARILIQYQLNPHQKKCSSRPHVIKHYNEKWKNVMLVCQRFRSVAVRTPQL
jgi:hypothetical protein